MTTTTRRFFATYTSADGCREVYAFRTARARDEWATIHGGTCVGRDSARSAIAATLRARVGGVQSGREALDQLGYTHSDR